MRGPGRRLPGSPLIITGMHRSGTSLTAALLQAAGVSIGERLQDLGGDVTQAHSEDLDFVELHQSVLAENGLSTAGWTLESEIRWSTVQAYQARALIERRAGVERWGWKDPRTVLVLPFWQALLPDAKLLFLYRSPWAVADSLFRRGDFELYSRPTLAIELWLHYNTLVLDVVERSSDRCLLVSADRVVADPAGLIASVRSRFGLDLTPPAHDIVDRWLFKPDILHQDRIWAIERLFPAALSVYDRLNVASGEGVTMLRRPSTPVTRNADPHTVFDQWIAACRAARPRVRAGR